MIAGMHRSGTSMLAQLLQASGLFIGQRLMDANRGNPEGHFEDLDFCELSCGVLSDNGLPWNGFVSDVAPVVSAERRRQAEELVGRRHALGRLWGWKDPRTILMLDLWSGLLPNAHFVFIFRAPWEVMDSLYRRGDAACQCDPMAALRSWLHYNSLVRDFVRTHPDRCLLFHVQQVLDAPELCLRSISERLGPGIRTTVSTLRPELLCRTSQDPHQSLVHAISPASTRLFRDLCINAGSEVPCGSRFVTGGTAHLLERSLREWAASAAALAGERSATGQAALCELPTSRAVNWPVEAADSLAATAEPRVRQPDAQAHEAQELTREVELRGISLSHLHGLLERMRTESELQREALDGAVAESHAGRLESETLRAELSTAMSEVATLRTELAECAGARDRLASEINRLMCSKSWRITAPFRALRRTLFTLAARVIG